MAPTSGRSDRTRARDSYRELFERSADAILIIEGETFIDCNDATVRMLGYGTREEVLQTHPSELSPPQQPDGRDSFEKANEMISIAFERGSHRFEWDHRRADGEVFPVEVLLTAVEEPGRRTLHVVWRDITERKLLEEELRQALKVEAIGKLTGGIAHDFNNLLVSIIGHADLLEEELGEHAVALRHIRGIRHAGDRAADLVRQLLAFGRKQQLLPVALDLNELIRGMRLLVERLVGEGIVVAEELAPDPIPIKVDRSQMEQVLLNLAANARDSMPDGGRLTIETRAWRPGRAAVEPGQSVPDGDHAHLVVRDTGAGMDRATAARAFDPFFTTKAAGRGSGLGLATVHGIVTQSCGSIALHSDVGEGTSVEILLPLTDEAIAAAAPVVRHEPQAHRGVERILVVEDEAAVADLVARALEARGYRIVTCRDGREASAYYQRHHDQIDLVLTDVIMPNLGGPGLVEELRRLGHRPRVLFMSGYTNEGLSALHESDREVRVLDKPFDIDELARCVRELLDEG